MDMSKYMGNVFLKVDDVKASGPIQVRITDISEGRFGKPDLTFHDRTQLSLNTTKAAEMSCSNPREGSLPVILIL